MGHCTEEKKKKKGLVLHNPIDNPEISRPPEFLVHGRVERLYNWF
jgi:hypothetical protein